MRRFEIWQVTLAPAFGSEMQKPRPAVVVSPDEMNGRKDGTERYRGYRFHTCDASGMSCTWSTFR